MSAAEAKGEEIKEEVKDTAAPDEEEEEAGECPICKMMREGGCEPQFKAFMDCGAEAEKGERDYEECIKGFEALRECMEKNPEAFGPLLSDVHGKEEAKEKEEKE
eukprot:gene1360-32723_t